MSALPIQDAARHALHRLGPTNREEESLAIARLAVDVVQNNQVEIVSMRLSEGALAWSCTCGQSQCAHAAQALRLLSNSTQGWRPESIDELTMRSSQAPLPPPSTAQGRAEDNSKLDLIALSESLEDVVTAVVRTGLVSKDAPSVFESVERLVKAAPEPLPLGVSRWIGRLRAELGHQNLTEVARLLDGATRLVDDLSGRHNHESAGARRLSWLGADARDSSLVALHSDRLFLELGRELLDGAQRASIERRYLMELGSGDIFREERVRGRQTVSLGSCPRVIQAGLSEVERGAAPPRIRLLQYASSRAVPQETWRKVSGHAVRDFTRLISRYQGELAVFPGLAEPVVCLAGIHMEDPGELRLVDNQGNLLPLTAGGHPTSLNYLKQRLSGFEIEFVLGRLLDRDGVLALRAIAGAVLDGDRIEHFHL